MIGKMNKHQHPLLFYSQPTAASNVMVINVILRFKIIGSLLTFLLLLGIDPFSLPPTSTFHGTFN